MVQSATILLADDDEELAELLCQLFAEHGLELVSVGDGAAAVAAVRDGEHDLLILDIMMPELSGLDALRLIREFSTIPVLMLTGKGDDVDRVVGLELGADDYLPKPFLPRELIARVRALLRRQGWGEQSDRPALGSSLDLREAQRAAYANGNRLALTATEYAVVRVLATRPGEVVSKAELAQSALQRKLHPLDRSIDTHISKIRRKLREAGVDDLRIENVRGAGYALVESKES